MFSILCFLICVPLLAEQVRIYTTTADGKKKLEYITAKSSKSKL